MIWWYIVPQRPESVGDYLGQLFGTTGNADKLSTKVNVWPGRILPHVLFVSTKIYATSIFQSLSEDPRLVKSTQYHNVQRETKVVVATRNNMARYAHQIITILQDYTTLYDSAIRRAFKMFSVSVWMSKTRDLKLCTYTLDMSVVAFLVRFSTICPWPSIALWDCRRRGYSAAWTGIPDYS